MSDIVTRLRDQGKDAFAKHYSLGMFKLCDEAASEIERLRKALENVWNYSNDPQVVQMARKALDGIPVGPPLTSPEGK